eukprot:COSAG03_NODE_19600_length_333_cov_1.923077_1_plen_56_part_10
MWSSKRALAKCGNETDSVNWNSMLAPLAGPRPGSGLQFKAVTWYQVGHLSLSLSLS